MIKEFVVSWIETGTISKGTRFSLIDNELLEHLKEHTSQTNSMLYPFIDTFIPMSLTVGATFALSFLVVR
jgi:hypothetical protein